jgi:hypothetical protein
MAMPLLEFVKMYSEHVNHFVLLISNCRLKGMPFSENVTYHMLITICMPTALSRHFVCEIIVDCYFDIKKLDLLRLKVIYSCDEDTM